MKLTSRQKEQLHRPRLGLFLAVLALLATPWMLLYALGAQVRQQKPSVDAQFEAYSSEIPVQSQNTSAETLERFAARLGLIPNITVKSPIVVNAQAREHFLEIESALNRYLSEQITKVSGQPDQMPVELQRYVNHHQQSLNAVQSHLLTQPAPQWTLDLSQLSETNYALLGFTNVLKLQKLFLLSTIYYQQQGQSDNALKMLEASWQLNQAIQQRSDLTSQTLASVVLSQQTGLIRHIGNLPEEWLARMNERSPEHSVINGVGFELWLRYHSSQQGFDAIAPFISTHPLQQQVDRLSALFSPKAYFQLVTLSKTIKANEALAKIAQLNICTTHPVVIERLMAQEMASPWYESTAISAFSTAKRWKIEEMRSLALELSQKVLWSKQQLKASGEWPVKLSADSSKVCPNERWIYTVDDDNTMSITFSKQLTTLPVIPIQYRDSSKKQQ